MASDDAHQLWVLPWVGTKCAPKSSSMLSRASSLGGSGFLAGSSFPARFTPGLWSCALWTREFAGGSRIPISERGRVVDLNCRWRKAALLSGRALLVRIINTSWLKGLHLCPLPLIMLLSGFDCWPGLGDTLSFKWWEQGRFFVTSVSWKVVYIYLLWHGWTVTRCWGEDFTFFNCSESWWRRYLDSLKIAIKDIRNCSFSSKLVL